jgi:uncharacterized protein
MSMNTNTPIEPSQRIDGIDILRGLALFGVMAINVVFEFRVSIFEQLLPDAGSGSAFDRALKHVLTAAVEMKAFALFSLLFGAGLAMQVERLAKTPKRTALLLRRLIALLAIGLAHLLFIWNGDILVEYAVAGLLVLPVLLGPPRLALGCAVAALLLYLIMALLPPVLPFPSQTWLRAHVAEATRVYGTGNFLDVLAFRLRELPAFMPLHVAVVPRTVALFLFGALAWRSGVLRGAQDYRLLLWALAIAGIHLGGGLVGAAEAGKLGRWQELGDRLGGVVLATGYAAAVMGIVSYAASQRLLAWAAPVGRMAFTNYISQSVIFGFIFYGYGLGQFGRLSVSTALGIGFAVYLVQIAFSAWWLSRYRYGPIEWLWRTLMYGVRQPMVLRRA